MSSGSLGFRTESSGLLEKQLIVNSFPSQSGKDFSPKNAPLEKLAHLGSASGLLEIGFGVR